MHVIVMTIDKNHILASLDEKEEKNSIKEILTFKKV